MPIFNRPGGGGGGPSPEPAPNNTQIYYEYIFDGSVVYDTTSTATQNATAPAAGYIRANNANTAIATVFAVANQTFNAQGIGTYMDRQAAGLDLNLRGVNAQQFGVYNMESAPTTGSGHRKFIVTPVNGLALADQDRIALSFTSTGNVKTNPTTGNLETNGVAVAPNILTVDTIAEALSLVTVNAGNDRKEFAVLDPGDNSSNTLIEPSVWNVLVDFTVRNMLRLIGGKQDFAFTTGVFRFRQPAANASGTPTTDSTILAGRTRLTLTAHGLTGTGAPTVTSYLVNQTAQNGWTQNEKVKILSIVDANTLIVDKLFSGLTGALLPDFYLITELMPTVQIKCPPLRSWSELIFDWFIKMPTSANNKVFQFDWGASATVAGTIFWGNGANATLTTTRAISMWMRINNQGATNLQSGTRIDNVNSGGLEVNITGGIEPVSSAIDSSSYTYGTLRVALAAAAEYIEFGRMGAACRW